MVAVFVQRRAVVLIAVVAVVTAVLGLTAATAWAQGAPSVQVTPGEASAGASIMVSGTGFQAGEVVSVDLGGSTIVATTSDEAGAFTAVGTVPSEMPPGVHPMAVTGDQGSLVELAFEVVAPGGTATPSPTAMPTPVPTSGPTVIVPQPSGLSLVINPQSAAPGERFTVVGGGFRPGESVAISFLGSEIGVSVANTAGAFLVNSIVPVGTPAGTYSVAAVGSAGSEVSTNYVVTEPVATPTPTPTPIPTATATPDAQPSATATPDGGTDAGADASPTPGAGAGTDDGPSDGDDESTSGVPAAAHPVAGGALRAAVGGLRAGAAGDVLAATPQRRRCTCRRW